MAHIMLGVVETGSQKGLPQMRLVLNSVASDMP